MTPWVLRLLVANVAVYFITSSGTVDLRYLALIPGAILIQPWGVFTYMFVHGGFMHLFWNMLGLFFFGPRLEAQLGDIQERILERALFNVLNRPKIKKMLLLGILLAVFTNILLVVFWGR